MSVCLKHPEGTKSPLSEWQDAYNRYFTHYAGMSTDFNDPDKNDYRARDRGVQWAHAMVDASLGAVWHQIYAGTPLEKRNRVWQKLKSNSVLLEAAREDSSAGQEMLPHEMEKPSVTESPAPQAEMRFG